MRKLMLGISVLMLCMVSMGHAQETGSIMYEIWDGIGGTTVPDLTGNANYPDNPTSGELLTLLEAPIDRADNFGGRIYGWLHPEITADYTFWVSADDYAQLWLSTTDSADDAALIASVDGWTSSRQWDNYETQQSTPISLTGGEKYYIEAIYKEGGGGDNLAVGWATEPNMALIEVIDGQYLSPAPMQDALLKARIVGPADGAIDLDPSVTLEWTPGPTAIMTQVYLSTDETIDADDMIAQTQDSSMVLDLELGQTYYWRVDAVTMEGAYEGIVQTFAVISDAAHFEGPADGATMQAIDSQLSWTTGLGALVHNVYVSIDKALVDARDPSVGTQYWATNTFDPGLLDYETTYYWAVDEFSGLTTVAGPTWSFTTLYSIPVTDENLVGWWTLTEAKNGLVMDMSGHGNVGTLMGDPEIVTVDGVTAMDFDGDGDFVFTGKSASDLGIGGNHARSVSSWIYTRSFGNGGIYDMGNRSGGQDFSLRTLDGVENSWRVQYWGGDNDFDFSYDTNDVWVHVAQVHDEVGTKIYMNGELIVDYAVTLDTPDNNPFQIAAYGWQSSFFDGMIRDVRLYDKALTAADVAALSLEIADITGPGAVVVGIPNDGDWPGGETPDLALDDDATTKYLHFKGETEPSGIQIAPTVGNTIVTGLSLTTANDSPPRDPATYEVYGSNESIDGPYELIAAGDIVDFAQADEWPRFTKNATAITFENTVAYDYYQVMFPTVRDAGAANSMQIAEIELLGKAPTIAWVSYHAGDDEPHSDAAAFDFTQAPDIDYTNLLKDQGYNVVRYVTTQSPDVDYLNGFDLVIISRTASSGHYSGSGASLWNSVTAPLINLNGYTLRSSRMGYTDGTTMVDSTGDVKLAVTDPAHPIFAGIALTDGVMDNLFAQGAVPLTTDETILSRGISINNNTIDSDGTVLATIAEVSADAGPVGALMIAELPAGATLENSSGSETDVLGAARLIFLTGSREPSGVTGGQAAALYDLYEDGTTMLLNAVDYMLP